MRWHLAFGNCVVAAAVTNGAAAAIYAIAAFRSPAAVVFAVALALCGGLLGVVDGVLRTVLARALRSKVRGTRITAAVTYAAVGALYGSMEPWSWHPLPICAATAAVVGGLVGPLTIFGPRPSQARRVWLGATVGAVAAGTCFGAEAGLVVGLFAYPPTAVAAAFEGASFGLWCGMVIAMLIATAGLPFLSPDVPAR